MGRVARRFIKLSYRVSLHALLPRLGLPCTNRDFEDVGQLVDDDVLIIDCERLKAWTVAIDLYASYS